jgi:hypothetical protein
MGTEKLAKLVVSYYDEARADDNISVGFREFVRANRKFGAKAAESGDMDALGYAAFLAAQRGGLTGAVDYDAWLDTVSMVAPAEDAAEGESQPQPS